MTNWTTDLKFIATQKLSDKETVEKFPLIWRRKNFKIAVIQI